ncbi:MAG: class I SAM-dependent methyltransferase [Bdellovibrionaceae bacterium]|nr:class I SAM-dependent methyltransferase [Pseudobdellovibrionaceae bacterium]
MTSKVRFSKTVSDCQVCSNLDLKPFLFLGYLPPVNEMVKVGSAIEERPSFPTQLLFCDQCKLVQLSTAVDQDILFPPEYPYTSGMTKILHDNFQNLQIESSELLDFSDNKKVIDIGSNDGTLLSKFQAAGFNVHGIEPTGTAKLAIAKGIPTENAFFSPQVAEKVKTNFGVARFVTATNVFAHIDDIHNIIKGIKILIDEKGVFCSENHYLGSLVETLQYDTIYHEHLRYYSVTTLKYLLEKNGLEIFRVKKIPTHGGSIRVYSAKKGLYPVDSSVNEIMVEEEKLCTTMPSLREFAHRVFLSKLEINSALYSIKMANERIYGIGAPSRSSTLINYVGLDENSIDCVCEMKGSLKLDKYMPGTMIPVKEEACLYQDQPEYAMLLSWHIADELIPKIKAKGFKGKFIVPLPHVRIVE